MSQVEDTVRRFREHTLSRAEWTHTAHLRVGLWYVHHFGAEDALVRLRSEIPRFNESIGGVNNDQTGYHETLTRFYILMIDRFLTDDPFDDDWDHSAERLIQLYGDRKLAWVYWTESVLFSVSARRGWIDPDRRSLPTAVTSTGDHPGEPESPNSACSQAG